MQPTARKKIVAEIFLLRGGAELSELSTVDINATPTFRAEHGRY